MIEYKYGFEADEVFEEWDANNDSAIDGDEFGNRFYDISETDNDDRLTVSEFDDAIDTLFGEETVNFSHDEFVQVASNSELYPLFDAERSGVIESDELENLLFETADRDGNGALDKDAFLPVQ